jgi:translation initiation factor IF-2
LTKEKIRVYVLARELNVDTKVLLDMCKQAGYDVKNQLSNLEPEQRDAIEAMLKAGSQKPAAGAPTSKPVLQAPLPDQRSVRNLDTRPTRPARPADEPAPAAEVTVTQPSEPAETAPPPADIPVVATLAAPPSQRPAQLPNIPASRMPNLANRPPQVRPPAPPAQPPRHAPAHPPAAAPAPHPTAPAPTSPATDRPGSAPTPRAPSPSAPAGPVAKQPPDLGNRPSGSGPARTPLRRPDLRPGLMVPKPPPTLRPTKLPEKKEAVAKPIATLTREQLTGARPVRPEDLLRPKVEAPSVPVIDDEEDDKKKGAKGGKTGAGGKAIPGREDRRRERAVRAEKRKTSDVKVVGGKLVTSDEDVHTKSLHRIKDRMMRKQKPGIIKPIGPTIIEPPASVRAISAALGINAVELTFKLKDHGIANANINTMLDAAAIELLAIDYGKEIELRTPLDAEDVMIQEFSSPDEADDLVYRAPIVTIMGHVDHGKTTLLDKIRKSDVAATEAGGITQVIRAWRVDHGGRPVTFLDTPGHQAFTKMRARGANVTDIAVIVVAADDGVMPQTEEAISHAKAAGVAIVVAINKTDMPAANIVKTRQQLYGLNVLPDDMGGDSPFVETSAATGKGIDELLDQLSVVAELKELKANPKRDGMGTCLEAMLSEGEGVRATLLVRNGTLRRGDVIVCGHAYGRVRQMYDDLGRPLEEAGPSVPVRITGLDEVPNADDAFYVLPDLALAREIADKRKTKISEISKTSRAPLTLERLGETKIIELKVILKADFRGSVEAIKKELEKLVHEEVRVRVLHSAIGAITESDVQLALTSPEDTIIVGFNVVPDDRALAMAEDKGVKINEYDIIYNLTNDVRAALEGKLKPREEIIHLGRALVRETFKISRVGVIAGCYVTQGNIKRNAKVRVIREGVVIYPPVDRTAGLDSLKRFKEDVGEVREGFECGIKLAGYDDIKVGDVIEAYRVEQVQRTLD